LDGATNPAFAKRALERLRRRMVDFDHLQLVLEVRPAKRQRV